MTAQLHELYSFEFNDCFGVLRSFWSQYRLKLEILMKRESVAQDREFCEAVRTLATMFFHSETATKIWLSWPNENALQECEALRDIFDRAYRWNTDRGRGGRDWCLEVATRIADTALPGRVNQPPCTCCPR